MTDPLAKRILADLEDYKADRGAVDSQWERLRKLFWPQRSSFVSSSETQGQRDRRTTVNLMGAQAVVDITDYTMASIINAQTDEIALMQQWLRDRRQPAPEPSPAGMRMTMGGVEHDMLMPGMLTDVQMKDLEKARGGDFEQRFLELMIYHHRGAVTMVNELLAARGAALDETVFKIAADISADQQTEIGRMQQMLLVRD